MIARGSLARRDHVFSPPSPASDFCGAAGPAKAPDLVADLNAETLLRAPSTGPVEEEERNTPGKVILKSALTFCSSFAAFNGRARMACENHSD
jgi:hypothetical protein